MSDEKRRALKNLYEIEEKVLDFQQLYLQTLEAKQNPPPVSINLEIETLKELIGNEENRIKKLSTPPLNFKLLSSKNYIRKQNISNSNLFFFFLSRTRRTAK